LEYPQDILSKYNALGILKKYRKTCPLNALEDGCISFARSHEYLEKNPPDRDKKACVIIPPAKEVPVFCGSVNFITSETPEYDFTIIHNNIYRFIDPEPPMLIGPSEIHPTVVMDVDGLKLVNTPYGTKVQLKHTGDVVIGGAVEIGPYTVIHRGTMGTTKIGNGCKIGAHNNIGHNCELGRGTVLAAGVILNGGVITGRRCWISSGAMIKHHVKICDDVVIGMGAVVTKDITKSGIYVGNPARYLKPVEKGWNF